jgi:hypothetical protein
MDFTKYTVIYGADIRFWPTLCIYGIGLAATSKYKVNEIIQIYSQSKYTVNEIIQIYSQSKYTAINSDFVHFLPTLFTRGVGCRCWAAPVG